MLIALHPTLGADRNDSTPTHCAPPPCFAFDFCLYVRLPIDDALWSESSLLIYFSPMVVKEVGRTTTSPGLFSRLWCLLATCLLTPGTIKSVAPSMRIRPEGQQSVDNGFPPEWQQKQSFSRSNSRRTHRPLFARGIFAGSLTGLPGIWCLILVGVRLGSVHREFICLFLFPRSHAMYTHRHERTNSSSSFSAKYVLLYVWLPGMPLRSIVFQTECTSTVIRDRSSPPGSPTRFPSGVCLLFFALFFLRFFTA